VPSQVVDMSESQGVGGKRIAHSLVLSLVLGALGAGGVTAQNAIANPELTPDAADWFGGGWDSEDADGCLLPGSLSLSSFVCQPIVGCTDLGFWRTHSGGCLPVTPGDEVHQDVLYTSDQFVFLYLAFASDGACAVAATIADNFASAPAFPSGGWQFASRTSVIPAGVHSVVAFFTSGGISSTDVDGKIDRAYLGLADRVFSDDFEGLSGCRWSFSVGET
jgi:hypothetical protein